MVKIIGYTNCMRSSKATKLIFIHFTIIPHNVKVIIIMVKSYARGDCSQSILLRIEYSPVQAQVDEVVGSVVSGGYSEDHMWVQG